jgi:hypothetical protein
MCVVTTKKKMQGKLIVGYPDNYTNNDYWIFNIKAKQIIKSRHLAILTWSLIGNVIDIKTAFLHGNLKETIFMEIPGYGLKK